MSGLADPHVLRPGPTGVRRWIAGRMSALMPTGLGLIRELGIVPLMGGMRIVTRHDQVREVFATDTAFAAPYWDKLRVITGDRPFMLAMADTPAYHADLAVMQRVMRADDLPMLAAETGRRAGSIVETAGGRLEVVDELVRRVTFDVIAAYLGVPSPPEGNLAVWATRLFEFQFADFKDDPALRRDVDAIAPAFRRLLDTEIARRKAAATPGDDVLGRCVTLQLTGEPGYSDEEIRTAILCMIVGGPPQPPMVVPQALEQLLRRPQALAGAQAAARANDDVLLRDYLIEAMRFDPLALGLPRTAAQSWTLAKGTKRERTIAAGASVLAGIAPAMMDPRRVPEPRRFRVGRPAHQYLHFGHGLHECFGRHINHATLHLMLKPLLKRPRLRRAQGGEGRLLKNGIFADRLVVEFD